MNVNQEYIKQYLDTPSSTESLTKISSLLGGTNNFNNDAIDYGMPDFAFLHLEVLLWLTMSQRSGCITYYEVLRLHRANHAVSVISTACFNTGFNELMINYGKGIGNSKNDKIMDSIDVWINDNENRVLSFLASNIEENRDLFLELFT